MRNQPLIERQVELLQFLSDPAVAFGEWDENDARLNPALRGIDVNLLRLEAELSFQKRLAKVEKVLRLTFLALSGEKVRVFQTFARANPPRSYRRIEDARAFVSFLRKGGAADVAPAFLLSLAELELAFSAIRLATQVPEQGPPTFVDTDEVGLSETAALHRCKYDFRSAFERGQLSNPDQGDFRLLVFLPPGHRHPKIASLDEEVWHLLHRLSSWPSYAALKADWPDVAERLQRIWKLGVVEVKR